MISYNNPELFLIDSISKQLQITGSGVNITNSNLNGEDFELEEILSSGNEIFFGECNAAKLSFSVGYYNNSIVGKELTATTTPYDGDPFQFGKYIVISDKPTADRKWRKVVAYDRLYFILKQNVADWYNTVLPDSSASITLKQFRDSFFTYIGLTQKTVVLPNDNLLINRTVDPKVITGKTVLTNLCEINGCFGRIGRDGQFEYVFLEEPEQGLFPAITLYPRADLYPEYYGFRNQIAEYGNIGLLPSNSIYPGMNIYPEKFYKGSSGLYISCQYEDYITQKIDRVNIYNADGGLGGYSGSGTNAYNIKDNFIVFGKTETELSQIAGVILGIIGGLFYRPAQIDLVGNPCYETGDGIQLNTTDGKQIDTYILKRKIKGIQSLRDAFVSNGLEQRENDLNSPSEQIVQIKNGIRKVEADLIEAKTIIAEEIQVERAKIDALTAIAITTENLSAQTISASQITTGTLDASRITVNNLSASSINTGQMSVERLTDIYGGSAQSRWYEITYVSSGSLTNWVSVRNGSDTGTVQVPTGLSLQAQRLYVLKGSPINP